MECLIQLRRVKEEKVRTERHVERRIPKRQIGKSGGDVASAVPACGVVVEEVRHRGHAKLAELLDRTNRVPNEFVCVLSCLLEDRVVGGIDSRTQVVGG